MSNSSFSLSFKRLIANRITELINEAQIIAEGRDERSFKISKLDEKLDMINHNFEVYSTFFKSPYGQKESILENVKLLYRVQ